MYDLLGSLFLPFGLTYQKACLLLEGFCEDFWNLQNIMSQVKDVFSKFVAKTLCSNITKEERKTLKDFRKGDSHMVLKQIKEFSSHYG